MASTNPEYWHARLGELVREHKVPGATLAFHHQGKVHEFAAGTLNLDTGAGAVTTASRKTLVDADTFVGRRPGEGAWSSLVFFTLPDGTPCLHYSGRATPKVG